MKDSKQGRKKGNKEGRKKRRKEGAQNKANQTHTTEQNEVSMRLYSGNIDLIEYCFAEESKIPLGYCIWYIIHHNTAYVFFQSSLCHTAKDVERTRRDFELFRRASTKASLTALLFVYAKLNPGVRYVQGRRAKGQLFGKEKWPCGKKVWSVLEAPWKMPVHITRCLSFWGCTAQQPFRQKRFSICKFVVSTCKALEWVYMGRKQLCSDIFSMSSLAVRALDRTYPSFSVERAYESLIQLSEGLVLLDWQHFSNTFKRAVFQLKWEDQEAKGFEPLRFF